MTTNVIGHVVGMYVVLKHTLHVSVKEILKLKGNFRLRTHVFKQSYWLKALNWSLDEGPKPRDP